MKKIRLTFMIAAHTRCLADTCFGLLKTKIQVRLLYDGATCGGGTQQRSKCCMPGPGISWRERDAFFAGDIRKVQNISQMHHFEFTSASVTATDRYRESLDDEWMFTDLLKTTKEQLIDAGLPPLIPAGGLSLKRQAYLPSDIRPFVPDAYKDTFALHLLLFPWTMSTPIPDKAIYYFV